jgi:PAS domain S-box-containing protein
VHRRLDTLGPLPPTAPDGDQLEDFLTLVHPDDLPAMHAVIAESLATPGRRYEIDYRVFRGDGSVAWLNEAGHAEAGPDGRPRRIIGISRDVSDIKGTEMRLREREEQLRHNMSELEELYARAPLGLGLLDTELRFVRINAALADINGLSVEDHLGKRVWDLLPGVRESAEPPLRAVMESSEPMLDVPVVGTTPARPGEVREWREQFYPIRGDGGAIIGIGIVCEEVTERLRMERALRAFSESLEQRVAEEVEKRETAMAVLAQSQKLDALGQLTAGIAHDFNNVVAAISGGFSLVERWSEQEKVREIARHGAEAARRGGDLVKHLLAFARQQVLAPKTVELHGLVENLRPLMAQSLGRGIGLAIATAPEPCWVHVDPLLLETALINLAVNARDAMQGGGDLRIAVQRADPLTSPLGEREACTIIVQDNGEGMAPDVLARALEPFFTTKDKGTGLGLAMVHGFARQSGGTLELDSAPGRGTRVTLTLPCAEPVLTGPETEVAAAANGSGQVVLLIDDDELVRMVTAHQLQELGYRVREAAGGDAAVAMLAAGERIDLVLCDVVMPREDGPAVAARIRARWPGLPIVFMTGHAERERLAGEAILDKPFTPGQLAAHVERHLLRDGTSHTKVH